MKKIVISVLLIGASAGYLLWRPADAGVSATTIPAVTTDTSGITVTPAPASGTPPPDTSTAAPAPAPVPAPAPKPSNGLKDGTFTGNQADAYYGLVQVKATIKSGKITNVTFLSYPSDRATSREISSKATPQLAQEAIAAQSANVNIVSGATATSQAFIESLGNALTQARG